MDIRNDAEAGRSREESKGPPTARVVSPKHCFSARGGLRSGSCRSSGAMDGTATLLVVFILARFGDASGYHGYSTDIECYQRAAVGKRLNETDASSKLPLGTIRLCEQECERSSCLAFSFGVSTLGNGTCELAAQTPKADPVYDVDYDLFFKNPKCLNRTSCFRRLATGRSLIDRLVKRTLYCDSLKACEETCGLERNFFCEGFNFKYDRTGYDQSKCQLTSVPSSKLDVTADFNADPDFDYYERDKNAPRSCLGLVPWGGSGSYGSGWNNNRPQYAFGHGYGQEPGRGHIHGGDKGGGWSQGKGGGGGGREGGGGWSQGGGGGWSQEGGGGGWSQGGGRGGGGGGWNKGEGGGGGLIPAGGGRPGADDRFNYHHHHHHHHPNVIPTDGGYYEGDRRPLSPPPQIGGGQFPPSRWDPSTTYPPSRSDGDRTFEYSGGGQHAFGLGNGYGLPDECFVRTKTGFKLARPIILLSVTVPSLYDCEYECVNLRKFDCNSFSFRYSLSPAVPGDNCHLAERPYNNLDPYTDVLPDRDYDIYERNLNGKDGCQPKRNWGSDCFERVKTGLKIKDGMAKFGLKTSSLSECEAACINIPFFTCRAFSFRYGPATIGDRNENCLLTDWTLPDMNFHKYFIVDPECELYYRGSYGHGCEVGRYPDYIPFGGFDRPRPDGGYLPPTKPGTGLLPPSDRPPQGGYIPPPQLPPPPPQERPQGGGSCCPQPPLLPPKEPGGYLPPAPPQLPPPERERPPIPLPLPPPERKPDDGYPRPSSRDPGFPPPPPAVIPRPSDKGYLPPPDKPHGWDYGYGHHHHKYHDHRRPPDDYSSGSYYPVGKPLDGRYVPPPATYIPPSQYGFKGGHGGFRPRPTDHLCYIRYSTPARLTPPAVKTAMWVPSEIDCKEECTRARDRTRFRCATISYRDGQCELSDIEQRDLRPGYDYLQDKSFFMFTWDFGTAACYNPPHPGQNNLLNDFNLYADRGGAESTWARFTVNGQPCSKGTVCAENPETGVWSCPVDSGDWDYCCRSGHHCGYSEGYNYPWCYVGSRDRDQWRPCSDSYYPYAHSGRKLHWPVAYLHKEGPPNATLEYKPSIVDKFFQTLDRERNRGSSTSSNGDSTTESAMDKLWNWGKSKFKNITSIATSTTVTLSSTSEASTSTVSSTSPSSTSTTTSSTSTEKPAR